MTTVKEQHQHQLKEPLLRAAVLFDTAAAADVEEQQPLPPTKQPVNNKQQQQETASVASSALIFLLGAFLGICSSSLGYQIHAAYSSTINLIAYSIVWSTLTSAVALGLYVVLEEYVGESRLREYMFAVGVFLGFCGACTVTDFVLGMPRISLLCTAAIAALWTGVMAYFARGEKNRDDHLATRVNKGVVLPATSSC
jgi:succinate dehydrogenase hydrophobic anchor subunit